MRRSVLAPLALILLAPAASAFTFVQALDAVSSGLGSENSACNVPESSGLGPYSRGYDTYLGFAVGNCGPVGNVCLGETICDKIRLDDGCDDESEPSDECPDG